MLKSRDMHPTTSAAKIGCSEVDMDELVPDRLDPCEVIVLGIDNAETQDSILAWKRRGSALSKRRLCAIS